MDCDRKGKWVRGCKFEPRYDLGPADITPFKTFKGTGAGSFLEKLRKKTYRGDVCVTCGKLVNDQRPE